MLIRLFTLLIYMLLRVVRVSVLNIYEIWHDLKSGFTILRNFSTDGVCIDN